MHIHTDFPALITGGIGALLLFHFLRLSGAWLANHGVGLGKYLGGIATFA